MPEYLDDPSVLTKDKLKSELLAHNVELPSGNPNKDVYVQLYLKNLTAQNKRHVPAAAAAALDAFSSDEELPPPVVSSRSRSSGRKATRKTDKVRPDEPDVTLLSDEGLRDELLKHGVDAGPIVASTRKLYERKLQKLLDDGPAPPQPVLTEIQVNHNGNSESDPYSDKEDEVPPAPEPEPEPEPVVEPEPVPLVERAVRSRGKTPVTTRTGSSSSSSSRHQLHVVEKITASDQNPKAEETFVLQELFTSEINTPTGITATCRRPIRGAAGRPVKPSDLWNSENGLFSPKTTWTSSRTSSTYAESAAVNKVASVPPSTRFTPSASAPSARLLSAAPPAGQTKAAAAAAARRGTSVWIKLFLLAVVAAFLFLVYQAMETNTINPFASLETEAAGGSAA